MSSRYELLGDACTGRLPGKPVACLSLGIVGLSPNISFSQDLSLFFQFLTKGLLGMSLFGVGCSF